MTEIEGDEPYFRVIDYDIGTLRSLLLPHIPKTESIHLIVQR